MTEEKEIIRYSTGVKDLDEILEGGLFLGENVVWEVESGTFAREFMDAFVTKGIVEGNSVIYFDFIYPPQAIMFHFQPLIKQLPEGWEHKLLVLDCFSEAGGQGELIFSDFYDKAPPWIKKVPSSKAYWQLIKNAHPTEFTAKIEHTTQVVIDLSKEQGRRLLTVRKGGRRYSPSTYERREYVTKGFEISFK